MTNPQPGERRLEQLLRREVQPKPQDDVLAGHVLQALAAEPLPLQRHSLLAGWWPVALLDVDLTPAWPRVAALACAGALGVAIGLFGADANVLDRRGSAAASTGAAETDLAALVFDPEPVTGVRP